MISEHKTKTKKTFHRAPRHVVINVLQPNNIIGCEHRHHGNPDDPGDYCFTNSYYKLGWSEDTKMIEKKLLMGETSFA